MTRERTIQDAIDRESNSGVKRKTKGQNIPTDFTIASVGIEDIDKAFFALFDGHIKHEIFVDGEPIVNDGPGNLRKVPVVFATGERFALIKRKKAIRDKNGLLILPLISIRRTGLSHTVEHGRGVAQDTGGLMVKRRLSSKDRKYQELINKLGLTNQKNVAHDLNFLDPGEDDEKKHVIPGRVASRRQKSPKYKKVHAGNELVNNIKDNIFEIIEIPYPQFFTAQYEVIYWTQYTQHMNTMLEQLMSSYQGQGNQFKLQTDKGYYFVAFINGDLSPDDNFDDFSDNERIIKYKISFDVPCYIFATDNPGEMIKLRSYFSAPTVNFEVFNGAIPVDRQKRSAVGTGDIDKFILSDVENLDKQGDRIVSTRTNVMYTRELIIDPFSKEKKMKLVRIKDRNQRKGETVINAEDLIELDDISL